MSFIRAHYIFIGNSAIDGQPDQSSAASGDDTNGNAMQFGARLDTTIPNSFINNANHIYAMQFGARWGLVVPNLFIDNTSCDDASCDDASSDDASSDDANNDDASSDDANNDDASCSEQNSESTNESAANQVADRATSNYSPLLGGSHLSERHDSAGTALLDLHTSWRENSRGVVCPTVDSCVSPIAGVLPVGDCDQRDFLVVDGSCLLDSGPSASQINFPLSHASKLSHTSTSTVASSPYHICYFSDTLMSAINTAINTTVGQNMFNYSDNEAKDGHSHMLASSPTKRLNLDQCSTTTHQQLCFLIILRVAQPQLDC